MMYADYDYWPPENVWVAFQEVLERTEKSIHIKYAEGLNLWLPLAICTQVTDHGAYVIDSAFYAIRREAIEMQRIPKTFEKPQVFKSEKQTKSIDPHNATNHLYTPSHT